MLFLAQFFTLLVIVTSLPPIDHEFSQKTLLAIKPKGRLSGEVLPTAYAVQFRFESDFFTTNTFTGTETITIATGNITTLDSSFEIHAKNMNITSMDLLSGTTSIGATFSEIDPDTDLVTVVPGEALLNETTYKLSVAFSGHLSPTSMVGLYITSYVDYFKQTRYAIATQFEETHARLAFPCFDEPEMKATFTLTTTYPKGYHPLSNKPTIGAPRADATDPSLETISFDRSPIMSSYLVALIVSPWNCKTGGKFNEKVDIQLCSEIAAMDASAKVALDAAPIILQRMSEFTGHNYSEISKLTLAGIPDFAPGAMENWGLVTFREIDLLWTEGESSNADLQLVWTVLTHELSHQWFGDMVTLEWWSSMFLNEGFATYFEYHIADMENPLWQLTKQFVIEQLQSALETDSYNSTLPLSYDVNIGDYSTRTNDLSYNKGGSILRMVHHFLTIDNYQLGIIDYINNNLLGSVTPTILWQSLDTYTTGLPAAQKPPSDMVTIMDSWTTKYGYPLLTVTAIGNNVTISQEQYVISGEGEGTEWYVPITYTTSNDPSNFAKTTTQAWLIPGEPLTLPEVLANADWILLNNQQVGYYRVNYDETLFGKISTALTSNATSFDEMSRAQIVDDQFSFAKAGRRNYNEVLNFLTFLKDDDSYYSWSSAFNGFNYLLKRTASDNVRNALKQHVRENMQHFLDSVPVDQDNSANHMVTLKQVLAHSWACKLDNEDCILNAREQFVNFTDYGIKPNPNMRDIVYCYGLRNSTFVSNDYTFLWEQYEQSKIFSERTTILKALGCVSDSTLRAKYLSNILTSRTINLQDARFMFSSVYSNHLEGVAEVLNFVMDNHKQLAANFTGTSILPSLISTLGDLVTTQSEISKLLALTQRPDLDADIQTAATNAITVATRNLETISTLEQTFITFFDISSGSVSIGSHYIINLVCVLIGYVIFNLD